MKKTIFKNLQNNIEYIKEKFDNSADLIFRELNLSNTKATIITLEGMVNKEILSEDVINPILNYNFENLNSNEKYIKIRDYIIFTSDQKEVFDFNETFKFLTSGFALICLDQNSKMIAVGVQGFNFRPVSEPSTEVMERGSREGFIEAIKINMTLIRRRMKNPDLKFETLELGKISKTEICLCYLQNSVSPKILKEVRKKIQNINIDTVFAAGYIAPFLEENCFSFFSSIGTSERPDTICAKIAEGKVAILIDGTPSVIIVPYLFLEYFQTFDDYALRPYFATMLRFIRYIAFIFSIITPGLYVAVCTFNPELLPEEITMKIAKSISSTPLPFLLETLAIFFIYEVMREAGLRLPKPLGHAVSIVGALVIGETAVSAKLVGAPTLMVIAISAILSYVIPKLYEPIALLRFLFILAGGIGGVFGIMLLFSATLINICSKSNFGIPFSSYIAPFSKNSLKDVFIRSSWKILSKNNNLIQQVKGSNLISEEKTTNE